MNTHGILALYHIIISPNNFDFSGYIWIRLNDNKACTDNGFIESFILPYISRKIYSLLEVHHQVFSGFFLAAATIPNKEDFFNPQAKKEHFSNGRSNFWSLNYMSVQISNNNFNMIPQVK